MNEKILGHLGIEKLLLKGGAHGNRETGVCLMEAVAWFAGESHSDRPACTSPVLAAYGRITNDWLNDEERQELVVLIPRLVGTAGNSALDIRRGQLLADRANMVFVPIANVAASAAESAESAAGSAWSAAARSAAAWSAAGSAWSAAAAAGSAWSAAAWSAAEYAARSARYAARSAAWSAAELRAELVKAAIAALVDALELQ